MTTEKTVLITGATGLLGTALLKSAPKKYRIIPTFLTNSRMENYLGYKFYSLDITSVREIHKIFKTFNPKIVIHCAGIGSVDLCEKNKRSAYKVNVMGTKNIINACSKYNSKLIFISSNAVFNGNNPPYTEDSKVSPVNYYGKTKVLSEKLIKKAKIDYVIVRLILMYGWNHLSERDNPVTWLIKKLKVEERVKLVNDTYTNPVLNIQAAKAIWSIVKFNKRGTFHVAGKECVNRFEFANLVADVFNLNKKLVEAVDSSYFKGIAMRMPNTTYDTSKMERELLIKPLSIKAGLKWMKKNPEKFYV
jgi:dTDP-4-dehydrorhamnose reductase